jgi:hypothetical protein
VRRLATALSFAELAPHDEAGFGIKSAGKPAQSKGVVMDQTWLKLRTGSDVYGEAFKTGMSVSKYGSMKHPFLLIILFGMLALYCLGGTRYYVDSRNGCDEHDGLSADMAWQTLEKVNGQTFSAGDRLLLKAGSVWGGRLKPQGSGTPESPICIDQYGDVESVDRFAGVPRIDAEGRFESALLLENVQGWEVRNLELTNKGAEDQPRRCGAIVRISDFGTARHIILDGLYVHDVNGSLVKHKGAGQAILVSNGGKKVKSRYDGLTIANCLIQRTQRNGIVFAGNALRSAWYPNLNVVVRGNLLEGVPGDGILPIGCDGALIEYNRMRDCPATLPEGQWAAGIWPWSCDNTVIQFNEVSDHKSPGDAQGFDSDWNCRNTIIQYNFSHDNDGGFLLICNNSKNLKPEDNIGNIGTIVRYNLSINDGIREPRSGVRYFEPSVIHMNGPCTDSQIYNNTIIVTGEEPGAVDRMSLEIGDWKGCGWPENTFFRNNIICVDGKLRYEIGDSINMVFENNAYCGEHENRPQDARAITADPEFLNRVTSVGPRGALSRTGFANDSFVRQFGLKSNSPCAGTGMFIPDNGGQDLMGRRLEANRCSVGAIQD